MRHHVNFMKKLLSTENFKSFCFSTLTFSVWDEIDKSAFHLIPWYAKCIWEHHRFIAEKMKVVQLQQSRQALMTPHLRPQVLRLMLPRSLACLTGRGSGSLVLKWKHLELFISDLIFCVYIFLWWRCYPLSDRRQSDHSQCREFLDWQPMKLTLHWTLTETLRMTGKDQRTHSKRTFLCKQSFAIC